MALTGHSVWRVRVGVPSVTPVLAVRYKYTFVLPSLLLVVFARTLQVSSCCDGIMEGVDCMYMQLIQYRHGLPVVVIPVVLRQQLTWALMLFIYLSYPGREE